MTATPKATTAHLDFLRMVNEERGRRGIAGLRLDPALNRAAAWTAAELAGKDYFPYDHVTRDGRTARRRVLDEGYPNAAATGENLLYGQGTARAAFDAWMGSDAHRQNMLSARYQAIGIAGPVDDAWSFANDVFQVWCTPFGSIVTGDVGVRLPPEQPVPTQPPPKEEGGDGKTRNRAERIARRQARLDRRLARLVEGRG